MFTGPSHSGVTSRDDTVGESPWDGPNGKLQGNVRVGAGTYVKMCYYNVAAVSLT